MSAADQNNIATRAWLKFVFSAVAAAGFLVGLIPRRRRVVCFIGHQGYYNGNARFLFEAYQKDLGPDHFRPADMRCLFVVRKGTPPLDMPPGFEILHLRTVRHWWRYAFALWRSKVLVITTPGYDWKLRHLLAWKAKTVLLSNGVPLKSPGSISKHFTATKTLKYLSFWRDIDQLWVSSTMERYIASASLRVPIEKIIVTGAARQVAFSEETLQGQKPRARKKLEELLGERVVGKRLALVALTQRAYKAGNRHNALDSISSLAGFETSVFQGFLQNNNIELVVRDHFLAQGGSTHSLSGVCSYMDTDVLAELNDVISAFDIVITDYSGLYLDLLTQETPIGLLRFPGDEFIARRGLILPDAVLSAGMTIESIEELQQLLLADQPQETQMEKRRMLHALFFEVSAQDCEAKNIAGLRQLIEDQS